MQLIDLERKIKIILRKNLKKTSWKNIENKLQFFIVKNLDRGDYSTNLLFLLDKFAPNEKEIILEKINKKLKNHFKKIEIVNNYLNFHLSDYVLFKVLRNIFKKGEKHFYSYIGRKRKIIVEYVSANPTGPLHIGNIRGAVLGDTLANFLKILGFRVTKEYYVNDRGTQVEILVKSILANLGKIPEEENFYKGDYVKEIARDLKEKIENINDLKKIEEMACNYVLENYIKPSLKKLGTSFDNYFSEKSLYQDKNKLEKIIELYKKMFLIEEKDGALILKLTKIGEIKDEFLIRANGEPTYFFSDILYHYNKFFERKFKIGVNILGADHHDHIRRLKKALEVLKIKESQIKIITYQHVHLKKEEKILKMSKRKGVFVTIDDLLSVINPGVVRIMFLSMTPETTLNFDMEIAQKVSEENPFWYLQYAYARLNNILKKAEERGYKIPEKFDPQKLAKFYIKEEEIKNLIRILHQFKDLSIIIYRELKPNLYYDYLLNVAKEIHHFYEKRRIIQEEKIDRRDLFLVKTLRDVLGFFLKIVNIEPMEKI